jgi:ribosomal protein S18 acetylase RimI-like enzyme
MPRRLRAALVTARRARGRFRPATARDLDPVLAMMRRYYAEDGYPFVEAEARRAAADLIRDRRLGRLWVARDGGRVVAYLAVTLGFSLEYRGRDAFVDELVVAEAARGRGLGREALETAAAYCRALGVRAVHLEVERRRGRARALYRRMGFADRARRLMTRWLDDPGSTNRAGCRHAPAAVRRSPGTAATTPRAGTRHAPERPSRRPSGTADGARATRARPRPGGMPRRAAASGRRAAGGRTR